MKIFDLNFLKNNLFIHPYDSNPDYFAKVNPFYFSLDKKFVIAYYEGTAGWFDIEINANQFNYITEGELEIISSYKSFNLKAGDFFLIEVNEKLKYRIKKDIKMFLFAYPVNKKVLKYLENLRK